jgi:hypothetical protein
MHRSNHFRISKAGYGRVALRANVSPALHKGANDGV